MKRDLSNASVCASSLNQIYINTQSHETDNVISNQTVSWCLALKFRLSSARRYPQLQFAVNHRGGVFSYKFGEHCNKMTEFRLLTKSNYFGHVPYIIDSDTN